MRSFHLSLIDWLSILVCLFDDIHPNEADKNPRLELFLMRTKATMMPYKDTIGVIDKIISNSVVFNSLPVEISESIEMMEVEKNYRICRRRRIKERNGLGLHKR